jgi:hypothetical protein
MNLASRTLVAALVFGTIFRMASFSYPVQAQDVPERPAFELRVAYLQAAGLHLPPGMPGILDVMKYHAGLSIHQEVSVEWNLIPDRELPVPRQDVPAGTLKPNFALLERKHMIKGSARVSTLTLNEMVLVTAAVSSEGEVRGLVVGPGTPLFRAEHWKGGGQDVVFPKETFTLFLPDDPKIDKLVFLLAHPDREKYRLEKVGSLKLDDPADLK